MDEVCEERAVNDLVVFVSDRGGRVSPESNWLSTFLGSDANKFDLTRQLVLSLIRQHSERFIEETDGTVRLVPRKGLEQQSLCYVFVGGISGLAVEDIVDAFEWAGSIRSIWVEQKTGRSSWGFVEFYSASVANIVLEKQTHYIIRANRVEVTKAVLQRVKSMYEKYPSSATVFTRPKPIDISSFPPLPSTEKKLAPDVRTPVKGSTHVLAKLKEIVTSARHTLEIAEEALHTYQESVLLEHEKPCSPPTCNACNKEPALYRISPCGHYSCAPCFSDVETFFSMGLDASAECPVCKSFVECFE